MKILLTIIFFFNTVFYAQSFERNVLIEIFTNSHCPICPAAHATLDAYLSQSQEPERINYIYYHMNYPYPDDLLHQHNPEDAAARNNYYGPFFSTPRPFFDGETQGNNYSLWADDINSRLASGTPVLINLSGTSEPDSFTISADVTMSPELQQNDLLIHIILLENVYYEGRNGITNHKHVMRKMLTGPNGMPIPIAAEQNVSNKWGLNGDWQIENLSITAFIQSTGSKEVYQSASILFGDLSFVDPNKYVMITSPNGGEIWEAGDVEEIQWISQNVDQIKIEFSVNNGISFETIADNVSASLQTYAWTVADLPSNECLVAISGKEGITSDWSDATFTINKTIIPEIILKQPMGGEVWTVGTEQQITWTATNIQGVKIEYTYDDGVNWIIVDSNIPDPLAGYVWVIPDTPSDLCRVKVSDALNPDIYDTSDSNFSITPIPKLELISPNGGEELVVGTNFEITWMDEQVTNVNLDYSIDNGSVWINIVSSAPTSGMFAWEIPDTPTLLGLLRISDSSNPELQDISDSNFTIEAPTTVKNNILSGVPVEYNLFQNFPNPFNPQTTIFYSLPEETYVEIKVYDVIGNEVRLLVSELKPLGNYQVSFDGHELNSGLYIYRIQAGRYSETKKMLLIK